MESEAAVQLLAEIARKTCALINWAKGYMKGIPCSLVRVSGAMLVEPNGIPLPTAVRLARRLGTWIQLGGMESPP